MRTFNSATIDLYLIYGVDEKMKLINELILDGWEFNVINDDIPKKDYPNARIHIGLYKTYISEE